MQAEIKGKDMTLVLPPAFAEQHTQSIKNFVMGGAFAVADMFLAALKLLNFVFCMAAEMLCKSCGCICMHPGS